MVYAKTHHCQTISSYFTFFFLFFIFDRNLFLAFPFIYFSLGSGNGLDVDEYVRRAYKFAYSDCIEVGPLASLPEPPDPNELYPRQSSRQALEVLTLFFHLYIIN